MFFLIAATQEVQEPIVVVRQTWHVFGFAKDVLVKVPRSQVQKYAPSLLKDQMPNEKNKIEIVFESGHFSGDALELMRKDDALTRYFTTGAIPPLRTVNERLEWHYIARSLGLLIPENTLNHYMLSTDKDVEQFVDKWPKLQCTSLALSIPHKKTGRFLNEAIKKTHQWSLDTLTIQFGCYGDQGIIRNLLSNMQVKGPVELTFNDFNPDYTLVIKSGSDLLAYLTRGAMPTFQSVSDKLDWQYLMTALSPSVYRSPFNDYSITTLEEANILAEKWPLIRYHRLNLRVQNINPAMMNALLQMQHLPAQLNLICDHFDMTYGAFLELPMFANFRDIKSASVSEVYEGDLNTLELSLSFFNGGSFSLKTRLKDIKTFNNKAVQALTTLLFNMPTLFSLRISILFKDMGQDTWEHLEHLQREKDLLFDDDGMRAIALALPTMLNLQDLTLEGYFGYWGAQAVAVGFSQLQSLQYVHMHGIFDHDASAMLTAQMAQCATPLKTLDVTPNATELETKKSLRVWYDHKLELMRAAQEHQMRVQRRKSLLASRHVIKMPQAEASDSSVSATDDDYMADFESDGEV